MSPDFKELVKYRLERANESLESAKILINESHYLSATNRLYYSCFYTVIALLLTVGNTPKTHEGTRNQFNLEFVKTNIVTKELSKIYLELFDYRQEDDYVDFIMPDENMAKEYELKAEYFINEITSIIFKKLDE
jgi:uncharacterized protein (UPF0332 family)